MLDGESEEDAGEEARIEVPRFDTVARRLDERAKEADRAAAWAAPCGEGTRSEIVSGAVAPVRVFAGLSALVRTFVLVEYYYY